MAIQKLLIANRGEVAIRIARACAELNIASVALFSEDDSTSLHTRKADEALALRGVGAKAYLDGAQILALAHEHRCDAVHPGYGFLSENAEFARQCQRQGLVFVGPDADTLALFGDKASARHRAQECGLALVPGTAGATSLTEAEAFFDSLGANAAVMIKAVAGGGGRGMRPVFERGELEAAYRRCQSEARAAFGSGDVYLERLVHRARHIEVQIIGDGQGQVAHLGERECTLQRRHQKLIEIAPCPSLDDRRRRKLCEAALTLAASCRYRGLGTFEFLLDRDSGDDFFIEANPRVQVEHTVSEMVSGIDLVMTQLQIAAGKSLVALNLTQAQIQPPRGFAVQLRINTERITPGGELIPSGGTLSTFELPSGPGVRVDTYGYAGYQTNPHYDALLAKLIVHSLSPRYGDAIRKAARALRECHIVGVHTNAPLLLELLKSEAIATNNIYTRYLDDHLPALLEAEQQATHSPLYFESTAVGARVTHLSNQEKEAPPGCQAVRAAMQGVIVEIAVSEGDRVRPGQPVAVLEAMKMEHVITAETGGVVRRIDQVAGDGLQKDQAILYIEPLAGLAACPMAEEQSDLDQIRADLQALFDRKALLEDRARPEAVARRHAKGKRTARENVADLVDPGSFLEYGGLAVAAQRSRRSLEDLQRNTPADGLIAGLGAVNGELFGDHPETQPNTRCAVLAYDYTVLAGTQGFFNHTKTDRILGIARDQRLPVVFFCEGGGGRPGEVDITHLLGNTAPTFTTLATLSGLVPLVGIVSGRCFAGNAALLGCHDVIIATREASVGMAGPAMIEGGGLGQVHPDEVGPAEMHAANGVVDILVEDEAAAVTAAKQYLSYFQGPLNDWACADQRILRQRIPENRLRSYDIRRIVHELADTGSVLELRRDFAPGMITALIRIKGCPFGLIANNSRHLGGAIDSPAADKGARFIQLCNAFDLPVVSLMDTPGFMVGPQAEKTAQVRHLARLFVVCANADIPFFGIALRKGYGLGAMAMAGGSFREPMFLVSWPTGEFGPMGLEGDVKLGYRKELQALEDPAQQQALFDRLLARAYEQGKATSAAILLEVDDVIDPAETRRWLIQGLRYSKPARGRAGKKVAFVDTW